MFISVEGIEGTGKSTLCRALVDALSATGREVVATREPGGTPVGDRLREIFLDPAERPAARTELLILAAARAELVEMVIRPALARGAIVLCDRYVDATLAYQGYGRGLPSDALRTSITLATGGLLPDLTLLIDLDPAVGLARIPAAQFDRIEREGAAFHERVRAGYLELARDDRRFRRIDGSGSREAVLAEALRAIDGLAAIDTEQAAR